MNINKQLLLASKLKAGSKDYNWNRTCSETRGSGQ